MCICSPGSLSYVCMACTLAVLANATVVFYSDRASEHSLPSFFLSTFHFLSTALSFYSFFLSSNTNSFYYSTFFPLSTFFLFFLSFFLSTTARLIFKSRASLSVSIARNALLLCTCTTCLAVASRSSYIFTHVVKLPYIKKKI